MHIISTEKKNKGTLSRLFQFLFSDHIFESAATLSYYFLFSVFPLTILVSAAFSTMHLENTDLSFLSNIIPSQIVSLLSHYLEEISVGNTASLIIIGLLLTFYSLGKAVQTLKRKFRIAYKSTVYGKFWREWSMSTVFVFLMLSSFYATLILAVAGNHIIHWLLTVFPFLSDVLPSIQFLRYAVLTAYLFFVLFGLYYILPGVRQKKRDVLPGTLFALTAWLVTSWGFSYYVDRFADYSSLYGSLGTIIILLTWLFLINVILLIGVYINAINFRDKETENHD